jgi:transcriptional regulator with GAF, ATPase, and Fis domain
MSGPSGPSGSAPAGAVKIASTEVIPRGGGAALRRIRKLRVVVVDGPAPEEHGRALVFAQDEIRVGSSPDVDVPLADPSVSREHLAIRLGSQGWSLTDLGSTNGTFVGALRVERASLADETTLQVGKTTLLFQPLAEAVEEEISPRVRFGRMLGASAAMRQTFALLERVAPTDLTVLVEGETGTGKELVAEGLHENGGRPGELVPVNCGAIPRELLESELFGHEKGSFTGAMRDRPGAFLAAHHGTLFLDEVGELPLDMQAKLLRALERREVKPVGADRAVPVDVRVVAATHRTLATEVAAGRFRQDLYYRLAVVIVRIPPLRTRLEDLPLLVQHIEDELARRRIANKLAPLPRLDEAGLAMLRRYDFPGNVRELRNVVERWAVLGATSESFGPGVTQEGATGTATPDGGAGLGALVGLPYHEAKDAWLDRFELAYVTACLERSGGNVSKAAREAGVDRRHLQRLMARFGLRGGDA